VRHGDGSLGWPEHAPYDAIVVTAGGPEVPPSLLKQLAVGGRLVMPVGASPLARQLVRVVRTGETTYEREDLGDVAFVPLIGAEGWPTRTR
jgi:protein-L-isoaspartate(D-aspartate) O-methyltransferase